jgi:hypothetical protein
VARSQLGADGWRGRRALLTAHAGFKGTRLELWGVREIHMLRPDPTMARRTHGRTNSLPGQRMVTETAAWQPACARNGNLHAITPEPITDDEALS